MIKPSALPQAATRTTKSDGKRNWQKRKSRTDEDDSGEVKDNKTKEHVEYYRSDSHSSAIIKEV